MTDIVFENGTASFDDLTFRLRRDDEAQLLLVKDCTIEGTEDDALALSKAIRGHPSIKELNLHNVRCSDEATGFDQVIAMALVTLPRLRILDLNNVQVSASALATIGFCTTLRELSVSNCGLEDDDLTIIAAGLAQSKSIEVIDLRGNKMSDVGCAAITSALDKNFSLRSVKLGGDGISVENCKKIQGKLQQRMAKAA